jgi:hypothetical protein
MSDMSDMCKQLYNNNYNTDIIDTMPDKVQAMWKKYSNNAFDRYIETKDEAINKPLTVSVVNHFAANQPIVDQISGTGQVTYMTNGDRKIYIFDDWTHSFDKTCSPVGVTITEYLNRVFSTADRFIDFYCEYEPTQRSKMWSYLTQIENTFKVCTTGDKVALLKHNCPVNVRIHFMDVRLEGAENPLHKPFLDGKNDYWAWSNDYVREYNKKIDDFRLIISSNSEYVKFMKIQIDKNPYVKKEISRLDKETREKVLHYFFTYTYDNIMPFINNLSNITSKMELSITIHTKLTQDEFRDFWYISAYPYIFIMDIYFLCRMLKKYNVKKDRSKNHPEYAKNIIVYAGSAHTKVYRDYLSVNGYKTTYTQFYYQPYLMKEEQAPSCLVITDMPQPLFSSKAMIHSQPNFTVTKSKIKECDIDQGKAGISKKDQYKTGNTAISKKDQYKIGNDIFFKINMDGVLYTDFYVDIPKNKVKELKLLAKYVHIPNYSKMLKPQLVELVKKNIKFV